MKAKKILAALLTFAMIIGMASITAFADDPVAKIGETFYTDFGTALTAWSAGQTLTLLTDVTSNATKTVEVTRNSGNYTLDLGSYVWTTNNCDAIMLRGAGSEPIAMNQGLTINAVEGGGINAGSKSCIKYENDSNISKIGDDRGYRPFLKINGGTYNGDYVVNYTTSAWSFTPTGAATTFAVGADGNAPVINGKLALGKCIANFNAGTFNGDINVYVVTSTSDVYIYAGTKFKTLVKPGNDKIVHYDSRKLYKDSDYWNVLASEPESYEAMVDSLSVKAGSYYITSKDGYASKYVYFASAQEAADSYNKIYAAPGKEISPSKTITSSFTIDASAEGASYTGTITLSNKNAKFIIVNGTDFTYDDSKVVASETLASQGYEVQKSVEDSTVTYTLALKEASINGKTYDKLTDAITAAAEGDTIDLRCNVKLTSSVSIAKAFTIALNNHSITNDKYFAVASNYEMIKEDGKIEFRNIEAKINDVNYATFSDALKNAVDGDVITLLQNVEAFEGTTEKHILINLDGFAINGKTGIDAVASLAADGYYAKAVSDSVYEIVKFEEKEIANENLTEEEVVDAINNIPAANISSVIDETIKEAIGNLSPDKKEEIKAETVKKINESADGGVAAGSSAKIRAEIARTTGADQLIVTEFAAEEVKAEQSDFAADLVQADGVEAMYFDVTIIDAGNVDIKITTIPAYIEVDMPDGKTIHNIKSVIRQHDGVVAPLAYTVLDPTTIAVASAQFSDFAIVFTAEPIEGKAVLGLANSTEETPDNQVAYDLWLMPSTAAILEKGLVSGEFDMSLTGNMSFARIVANERLKITNVDGNKYHYELTTAAADADLYPEVDTGKQAIKIATLYIEGTGAGRIALENAKTRAEKTTDSIEKDIETSVAGSENFVIKPTYETLTIKIAYNNAISNQATAYQDMKIKISGLGYDETFKLGSDASLNVSFDSENCTYTLTIADKLVKDMSYNVTVEGAGYRTARHTVTMTDAKTLNFWNNVKDEGNAMAIEAGKATMKSNFLAGDIVKDNNINIYDLSAVVSYFGTTGLSATNHLEYAKYDLNRDGKIDSKDVAYVLVSWNN